MRLCFVDLAPWDYNVATPIERPLGGSQSALCYLAAALARMGHEVSTLTHTSQPGTIDGVECLSLDRGGGADFIPDVAVFLNSPSSDLFSSSRTRRVFWTQHAANQVAMRKLAQPEIRDRWDDIICVSDWQARDVSARFGLERVAVLRNAIAPAFEGLFSSVGEFIASKAGQPRLAYTSTPYRGLQFLSSIFPAYRKAYPGATLDAYSSMAVYMESREKDCQQFGAIYGALEKIDGVRLVGSLSQPELAMRLASTHIWAYPNAFPETSCIAAMEAMAAGLQVVTSNLGALPETCGGFATLVPIEIEINEANASIAVKGGNDYVSAFTEALLNARCNPASPFAQVRHMNDNHTWTVRAKQWTDYLNAA